MPIQNSKRRRRLLQAMGAAGVTSTAFLLSGCALGSKKNIKDFGKTFDYLLDPELRAKETGDALLVVKGALFSGTEFRGQTWRNVKLVDCDFVGAYEIKLQAMENSSFEHCTFSGVIDFGVMTHVRLFKCESGGASTWGGQTGSTDVLFEECRFIGANSDQNHQGGIGTYGDAKFLRCKVKWFALVGDTKLVIDDCECESIRASLSDEKKGSVVLIERSKFRGLLDMVSTSLQSLTLRDTVLDALDLSRAGVNGDIVMERVRAGYMDVYVSEAQSLTMRNCQISGNGDKVFQAYAGGIKTIDIDGVTFGGGLSTEPVKIAGGTGADLSNVKKRVSESIVIRNSKVPRLNTRHINTASYLLQGCEIDSLDLSNSRIGSLEVSGNSISRTVDFSSTQVQESKVQPLAKGQAKLDGSNVKVG